MTVLYMFIFELNRIKILLQGPEDFEQKLKLLKIIRGICILLTFLAVILISLNNLNFNLPEEDQFLTDQSEKGLEITSALIKLVVDIYIYWNLSQSIKYLYREFKQNYNEKEVNQ